MKADPSPPVRSRVVVDGQVQGVFYRVTCAREAAARGLAGWVRNRPDGRVEAVFEGDDGAVEVLVDWCRHGPPGAAVDQIEVWREPAEGLDEFRIIG
jgi:acylphosphatase